MSPPPQGALWRPVEHLARVEQRRYALQHTLRYQIWELDQPHYLHAHGRSLNGQQVDSDHAERFAAVDRWWPS